MSTRYRITPQGRPTEPTDEEIARYRDPDRLLYNYQRAVRSFHRRPLYRDPKAFLALLLILLLAWLLGDAAERGSRDAPAPAATEHPEP